MRAQSICSANPTCFRQQQQQQLQWYAVPMHPHKGTVGLRPIPPCVRASELCTTDGARTSQQQQQQQQRLVRRRVISPPYDLRARKPYTHPCSRISTSREVFSRGEPALTCCRDCSCPPEGRDKPTPWYADVIFLSIEPSTPTGRPRSHLLVDVPPPTPISAQELPAPDLHWRERRTRIKGKGHWDNRQRRPRSHLTTALAFNTHPCSRMHSTVVLIEGKAALTLAWIVCTLPAAPIPAQELSQATPFPLQRRPRSHFAHSPLRSDRTRIAPSPLKNLDSSRVGGNL